MKNHPKFTTILSLVVVVLTFYSCSKSNQVAPAAAPSTINVTGPGHHVYGLLPTTPEEYASIPVYSKEDFQQKFALNSVTGAPAVLTLATPGVRDQGKLAHVPVFAVPRLMKYCGTINMGHSHQY